MNFITKLKYAAVFLIVIAVVLSAPARAYLTLNTVENAKITDKVRSVDKNSSKYLIFTDKEVFENTDTWYFLKFNSSDVYGKISVGQSCTFKVNGFRFGLFSWYRNILEAECHDE